MFRFLRIKGWTNVSKGKLITGLKGGRNEPLVKVSLCVWVCLVEQISSFKESGFSLWCMCWCVYSTCA